LKKIISSILILLTSLVLTACNKDSSNNPKSEPDTVKKLAIPNTVLDKPIINKKWLNDSEKNQVISFFVESSMIPFDVTAAYLKDTKSIDQLPDVQKRYAKDLIAKCVIPMPLHDETKNKEQFETGLIVSAVDIFSIYGANCPAEYSKKVNSSTNYELIDQNLGLVRAAYSESQSTMTKIRDDNYVNAVKFYSMQTSSNSTGNIEINHSLNNSSFYFAQQLSQKTDSAIHNNVDLTGLAEVLNRAENGNTTLFEIYIQYNYVFPFADVTIQMFISKDGQKLFINGEPVGAQKAKSALGALAPKFPALQGL
jgi:hypothetical protein